MTKRDCGMMLPSGIKQMLETYECEVPDWEHALYILQNEKWGDFIIIHREETESGDLTGKILKIHRSGELQVGAFLTKEDRMTTKQFGTSKEEQTLQDKIKAREIIQTVLEYGVNQVQIEQMIYILAMNLENS